MSYLLEVCLIVFTLAANIMPSMAATGAAPAGENPSFAGRWSGKRNGLPGVSLKIVQKGSELTGSAVFYLQKRDTAERPWHVAGESSVTLLAPHLEQRTLWFEVEHHRCDTCAELGPNVKFRMELTGPNEARLWKLDEPGSGTKLIRETARDEQASPHLQAGVSVQMPATQHAMPLPEADQEDALIVAVTRNGQAYLHVDQVTPSALTARLRASLNRQKERTVYVKADARTAYAGVATVLDAIRAADLESMFLLTSQPVRPQPGVPVPPYGLEIKIGAVPSGVPHVDLRVLRSGLQANSRQVTWSSLEGALRDLLQNREEKVVVSSEGDLPFGDVVKAIDSCRAAEAEVLLRTGDGH